MPCKDSECCGFVGAAPFQVVVPLHEKECLCVCSVVTCVKDRLVFTVLVLADWSSSQQPWRTLPASATAGR